MFSFVNFAKELNFIIKYKRESSGIHGIYIFQSKYTSKKIDNNLTETLITQLSLGQSDHFSPNLFELINSDLCFVQYI